MSHPDHSTAHWFKSSRSTNNGDCVECAHLPGQVAVRDSKASSQATLVFTSTQWSAFLSAVRSATFVSHQVN
ncbi:DUF397 domain-containing protein [Micromonospora sp. NPDC003197]